MSSTPLAQYLRLLREKAGVTQEEIADYLGMSRQNYSHYETSRNIPPTESLYKISLYYNISLDKLVRLAAMSIKGEQTEVDSSILLDNSKGSDLQADLDNLYVDFLEKCSDMKPSEMKNWMKIEDMELIHNYHKLTKRNKKIVNYLVRIMNLKDL